MQRSFKAPLNTLVRNLKCLQGTSGKEESFEAGSKMHEGRAARGQRQLQKFITKETTNTDKKGLCKQQKEEFGEMPKGPPRLPYFADSVVKRERDSNFFSL